MRDFSKVSPSVWRSKKFRKLADDTAKLVYLYLLTCPHGNSAGCFDLDPAYACTDLGVDEKAYRKAINSLCKVGLIEFDEDENTVFLINWATFNEPTNPKHAIGLLAKLDSASSARLKLMALEDAWRSIEGKGFDNSDALRKARDTLSKAYREALAPDQTRPDLDQKETETETDLDEGEEEPPVKDEIRPVVDHWNAMAKANGLSVVKLLTDARRKALKTRIDEAGGVDQFRAAIDKVPQSSFLLGDNDRKWKADLDFILQPTSFARLIEGKYHNQFTPNGHHAGTPANTDAFAVSWEDRIAFARDNRAWPAKWGPYPNQPGCLVPAALVNPDDGKGWIDWKPKGAS